MTSITLDVNSMYVGIGLGLGIATIIQVLYNYLKLKNQVKERDFTRHKKE